MENPEPTISENDIKVARMIEELLRTSVIQKEGLINHHEIHIGVAPIRVPVAKHKKGNDHSKKDKAQRLVPCLHVQETLEVSEFLRFVAHSPERHRCPHTSCNFVERSRSRFFD